MVTKTIIPLDIQAKIDYRIIEARFVERWSDKPFRQWLFRKKYLQEYDELQAEQAKVLPRITDVLGLCLLCSWTGRVFDMEPDVDGDGSLGCPKCGNIIEVKG